ncbi:MAG: cbb3-type cytochrome oxidase assembly protein CcoS [Alphaproteobacteria bacterium]|nr:cbb3-type cytochrome oxidase assembly protein CcoS [Alphaproteobacteria bacterium]
MSGLLYLIPVAIGLGAIGLAAFLWSLKSAQFEDLDGAANRILFDDDAPERRNATSDPPEKTQSPPGGPHEPG